MAKIQEFSPQRSNHVQRLSYDPETQTLFITFKNEAQEGYAGVPSHVFAEMTRAPSVGTYFHHVIKLHYKRIERTPGKRAL